MRTQDSTTTSIRSARRRIRGQGLTEYIIVVALVAIAAVAAVSFFGAAVKGQFVKLGGELINAPDDTGLTAAAAAKTAATAKNGASTLSDYGSAGGGAATAGN